MSQENGCRNIAGLSNYSVWGERWCSNGLITSTTFIFLPSPDRSNREESRDPDPGFHLP